MTLEEIAFQIFLQRLGVWWKDPRDARPVEQLAKESFDIAGFFKEEALKRK